MDELRSVMRDRWLWAALVLGLVLRVLPLVLWPNTECIRDECIYRSIAYRIVQGEGLTVSPKGWLPAPGYPYLLAWSKEYTGSMQSVKALQLALSGVSLVALFGISWRVAGLRAARVAAFLFAVHPTLIFFTGTMWIETVYICLLLVAIWAALWAKDQEHPLAALAPGVALGGAVLFRGIATYLPPMFALAILWPAGGARDVDGWRQTLRSRSRHVAVLVLGTVLTVAPWSIYATPRQGGFLVSDATVGHVMWLGNNDYPPLTFDYGNGMLTDDLFAKYLKLGRKPCDRKEPPVQSSQCDVQASLTWIAQNPGEFVGRVPMRLAQLFNPNSFLTRHIRWGYWPGMPFALKEGMVLYILLTSLAVQGLGTVAVFARARGSYAVMSVLVVAYTVFASAIMYGMSRFRLPLEPLWMVYLAWALSDPRGTWDALRASPARLAGAVVTSLALAVLMAWYLPTGFPYLW